MNRKRMRKWKVFNNKKHLSFLCEQEVNLSVVRRTLEKTKTYFLNEYGLTIQLDNVRVTMAQSTYMFANLENYSGKNGEPIFAWARKKNNGEFGCASFGTRYEFDEFIVETLKSKIQ